MQVAAGLHEEDAGSRGEDRLAKGRSPLPREPAVSDRARLDVSAPVLKAVTGWIARHRRRPGARPGQRAGTVHTQVVLVLRWLRHRLDLRTLALQARVSISTAYRYLHEGLEVIAAHAPDLGQLLADARELVLPTLYPYAARGLPVLADKGYTGAGIGVLVPYKNRPEGPLHLNSRCYNELITALRAPAERANALLGRWRALDRVTVCPQRIGTIAAAALVLTSLDRGTR